MAKPGGHGLGDIEGAIVVVRGHRAILDIDLATMYRVEVRVLVQAVKRNLARFPSDFMFQLTLDATLQRSRSQNVILNAKEFAIIEVSTATRGRGKNLKYRPYAFSEQGVAMLSSVLRSPRAIEVNIEIMRAFVRLRRILEGNAELARKVAALDDKYDGQFRVVFDAIRELMAEPDLPERPIGFRGT
jgi:hypothetical protein